MRIQADSCVTNQSIENGPHALSQPQALGLHLTRFWALCPGLLGFVPLALVHTARDPFWTLRAACLSHETRGFIDVQPLYSPPARSAARTMSAHMRNCLAHVTLP